MVFDGGDGENDNDYFSNETDTDDDDDEDEVLEYMHDTLRKIKANDPTLTTLKIGLPERRFPGSEEPLFWEAIGNAIGSRNTVEGNFI